MGTYLKSTIGRRANMDVQGNKGKGTMMMGVCDRLTGQREAINIKNEHCEESKTANK